METMVGIAIAIVVIIIIALLLLVYYKPWETKTDTTTKKSSFDKLNERIDAAQKKILEGKDPQVKQGNTISYDHTNVIMGQERTHVMQALDNAIGKFLQNMTWETEQTQRSIRNSVQDARTQFEMRQNESRNAVAECSGEVVEKVATGEVEDDISSVKVRVCKWFISCDSRT